MEQVDQTSMLVSSKLEWFFWRICNCVLFIPLPLWVEANGVVLWHLLSIAGWHDHLENYQLLLPAILGLVALA